MTDYKSTATYKKWPVVAKTIINTFASDGDKDALFKSINEHVKSLSANTAYVRRSEFRGMLRRHFGLTNDDLEPVKHSDRATKEYNASLQEAASERKEVDVSKKLYDNIINSGLIPELLCRSGLRIQELISNVYIRDGKVYAVISKKRPGPDPGYRNIAVPIYILGDTQDWIAKYHEINPADLIPATLANYTNRNLNKIIPHDFPRRNSHICRALYARAIYQFRNPERKQFHQIVSKYLHHQNNDTAKNYAYIILDPAIGDNYPRAKYNKDSLQNKTVKELDELLRTNNVKGRSKLRTKTQKINRLLDIPSAVANDHVENIRVEIKPEPEEQKVDKPDEIPPAVENDHPKKYLLEEISEDEPILMKLIELIVTGKIKDQGNFPSDIHKQMQAKFSNYFMGGYELEGDNEGLIRIMDTDSNTLQIGFEDGEITVDL